MELAKHRHDVTGVCNVALWCMLGTVDSHGYVKAEVNGNVGLVPFRYILPVPLHIREKILQATRVSLG